MLGNAKFIDKSSVISQMPLFSNLTNRDREAVASRASLIEYKKGEIIYKQSDPPDAFYCIVSGRVSVYVLDGHGEENALEYLHRGNYFGIISLLTGESHSVYSRAINDSILLRIEKKDFDSLLEEIPKLAIHLSLTLSRRLKRKDLHPKSIFESTIVAVYSCYSRAGRTIYATNLALSLKKQTNKNVILVDISPKPGRIAKLFNLESGYGIVDMASYRFEQNKIKNYILRDIFGIDLFSIAHIPRQAYDFDQVTHILSYLTNDYHFIVVDLPYQMDEVVFKALSQADFVHILTSPTHQDLSRTYHLVERLKREIKYEEEKIKVLLNQHKDSILSHQDIVYILKHPVLATLPNIEIEHNIANQARLVEIYPDCEYAKAVRRISRQLGDVLVGLALGSGAAFGLAHIGVLKVLEEEKIPIDVIVGTSVGSMVAALWASGTTAAEIQDIFSQIKNKRIFLSISDLTLPKVSFFKGSNIAKFLRKYLGKKTFHDLKIPLKIICCDIRNKRELVIEDGDLKEAVMASMAMPGIFRPIIKDKSVLMDGGILSPLPTNTLVKSGFRKIIAVNVVPAPEDILRIREKLKLREDKEISEINKKPILERNILLFKRALRNMYNQNILDYIFTSIETMQYVLVRLGIEQADITLHPDTSGLNWFEFSQVEELIRRGEEETRINLPKIKEIISE